MRASLLLLAPLTLALPLAALEVPYATGFVVDEARLLSDGAKVQLEAKLRSHEAKTSNQVVVLTIPSLQGEALEEYALKVARTWKVGQGEKKNGVLLLIVKDDRKLRIEVGYGLEGSLPDVICGRIIRDEIVPQLKQGAYERGVEAGVDAILAAIQGAYTPSKGDTIHQTGSGGRAAEPSLGARIVGSLIVLAVLGTFTFLGLANRGCVCWALYVFLVPFWALFPIALLGKVLGTAVFGTYLIGFPIARTLFGKTLAAFGSSASRGWSSRSSGGWSSGGGWSSSSSSDSSSSSSGFSGGGGDFGGGGASGSW